MRRRTAVLLASCLAALTVAGRATSQPGDLPLPHLHFRDPEIPVNLAALDAAKEKPAAIQLWYRQPGMKWQAGNKHTIDRIPAISGGRNGFKFTAPSDGEFEFAVQLHYADGSVSPRESELRAIHRAMIDTVPPQVEVRVNGKSISWRATDANKLPNIQLQCKWARDTNGKSFGLDEGEWFTISPKGREAFRSDDTFDWSGILPPGQELWARVTARDQAGNDGFSPPVRVPSNGTFGTAFPKNGNTNPDWPPNANSGNPGLPKQPQPRIEYVSSKDVALDFTLRKVGRSGVQAFHLYSQKQQNGTAWKFVEKFPRQLLASEKEQPVTLKFTADDEGLFGFYVIPESGAGEKLDPPGPNDSPMMYVVVDCTKPYAKITGVQARPGGARGPLVDITWQVGDPNLMPRGISLEYSVDKIAPVWKPIGVGLDNEPGDKNTGRFTWEVPDENLWKFYVRIRAVDKAANTGEHIWDKEVIVDLEKPSGVLTGVRGGNGSPPPRDNGPGPINPMKPLDTLPKGPPLPNLPDDK